MHFTNWRLHSDEMIAVLFLSVFYVQKKSKFIVCYLQLRVVSRKKMNKDGNIISKVSQRNDWVCSYNY